MKQVGIKVKKLIWNDIGNYVDNSVTFSLRFDVRCRTWKVIERRLGWSVPIWGKGYL